MERYICIHGHFYQPPRENSWLEAVELQDGAYPYHDWNQRITAESYATNAASRIADDEGRIIRIVNNYSKISFNFGPTLLIWMEEKAPEVYRAILEADQESRERFSGHGSALAQTYNHMIMPLANNRDKETQVLWGIRDFQHRFRRSPEGMWLPETAADLESLDLMAREGVLFTVLAPHQAKRVRRMGEEGWQEVNGEALDPSMAYELRLPSGRKMVIFFYDDPISRAVAFEGLLSKGEHFANRLLGAFSEARSWPQLVHIATDGETYGHHHRFGDMALAYALHYIESNDLAQLTNYGEYLQRHPPTHEVEIYEDTSWSCSHGVERWRSNCGCNTGLHPGWSQEWRSPLRSALDWLRDTLAPTFEEKGRLWLRDPWAARNDYIQVVLDRSPESVERFLQRHALPELEEEEKVKVLKLLELQRHAMLMYTSCGWFFDDLAGIETVQVLQYAGRALQLAQQLFGDALEARFLRLLQEAKSNVPERADGHRLYEQFVKPAMVNLQGVGGHYAISSLFEEYPDRARIYCYTAEREDYQTFEAGRAKLAMGRVRITSGITREAAGLDFGVLHLGDHTIACGIREQVGMEAYQTIVEEVTAAFNRADFPQVLRFLDAHFGGSTYSLKSLFRDEQRKTVGIVLDSTLAEAEAQYRQLYEHHAPLMRFLADLGVPLPKAFHTAAEMTLNSNLRRALEEAPPDLDQARSLLEEARRWQVELDVPGLEYWLTQALERLAEEFRRQPQEMALLQSLKDVVDFVPSVPFPVDLWRAQNSYWEAWQHTYPRQKKGAEAGEEHAREWVDRFIALGTALRVQVA